MYISMAYQAFSATRLGQIEILEIDENELDSSNLQAHILSAEARQRLLSDQQHPWAVQPSGTHTHSFEPDDDVDAETLLEDLGRLAPTVAKNFLPKSHARESLVLRLINDEDSVGEEESYVALSYCWKKVQREVPRTVVSPVGEIPFGLVRTDVQWPLPVSEGLWHACLGERESGEGLWFDQVCINQEDEVEKAMAIGAMDSIYRNARSVVVALDDIAISESEASFLRYYIEGYGSSDLPANQQPNQGLNPPFMQQHAPFRSFLERVLSSVWFERAWCAHEMRLARAHVFLVPCYSYDEEEPFTFVRFTGAFFLHMLVLASELVTTSPAAQARLCSLYELFSRSVLQTDHPIAYPPSLKLSLPQSLDNSSTFIPSISQIFSLKAFGNPRLPAYLRHLDANRDKTCICLSTSGLPIALQPASALQRPNIEDECLRQLLLVGLAARDPVSLCTTGAPLQLHDGSVSWLCRPSPLDTFSTNQQLLQRFPKKIGTITQASDGQSEYIQLDLMFCDLPHRTTPNPNFTTNMQRAHAIIDLCTQYHIPSGSLWTMWQGPGHTRAPALKNAFVQTLACLFECGLPWTLSVLSKLGSTLDPQATDLLFAPQLHLQAYVQHPAARPALSHLLNALCTLISHGIPWASGATESTHGPLLISPPSQSLSPTLHSPYTAHPHSHPPQGLGRALVFAPFAHSRTLLVAVPDAVKGVAYEGLARGWILTSRNPYTGSPNAGVSSGGAAVCWTLQGKSVVFGDTGFAEGLSGSSLGAGGGGLRTHRVFGPHVGVGGM